MSSKGEDLEVQRVLIDIYKIHIDEYRYNVSLTWDRTRYLLTLNSTLTVAGLTLFRFANAPLEYFFLATIALLTILTSWFSVQVAVLGKQYFRNSKYVLREAEEKLGLHSPGNELSGLGIATTDRHTETTAGTDVPPKRKTGKRATITQRIRIIFYFLIAINILIVGMSLYNVWLAWYHPTADDLLEGSRIIL